VRAVLAAEGHRALQFACPFGSPRAVALLAAAYGPPGCAVLRAAVADSHILHTVFSVLIASNSPTPGTVARLDATLTALLAALGEPDCAAALSAVSAWLEAPKSWTSPNCGIKFYTPAQRLARIPPDSLLARLAVQTPQAWALNPNAAHALLSAPVRSVRSSLALPALMALRRLPGGVAAPVAAHLRARPWLLFAGAVASALAAAPPPTA
jgi:hypothetical protein